MKKKILIVNPVSNRGHFNSWRDIFKRNIECLGYDVKVIDEHVMSVPVTKDLIQGSQIELIGKVNLSKNSEEASRPPWPILRFSLMKFIIKGIKTYYPPHVYILQKIDPLLRKIHKGLIFTQKGAASEYLANFVSSLSSEDIRKWKPDLVIHLFADLLGESNKQWKLLSSQIPYKFCALHFNPLRFTLNALYSNPNFVGMIYLDSKAVETYGARYPSLFFDKIPDIANSNLPSSNDKNAQEILSMARGRKIIFMGGTIGRRKNLNAWLDLVNYADPLKFYFVQVGEIMWQEFSPIFQVRISIFLTDPPPNFYHYTSYVEDESIFNSIIAVSDVIFAVYDKFNGSSNMISKAAFFRKPILVSKSSPIMSKLVSDYGVGLVINNSSVNELYDDLCVASEMRLPDSILEKYLDAHSETALRGELNPFFSKIFNTYK